MRTAKTSMYGMVLVHVDGQKKREWRQSHGMYALKHEGSANLWPLPYTGRRRMTKEEVEQQTGGRGRYRRRDARYTKKPPCRTAHRRP